MAETPNLTPDQLKAAILLHEGKTEIETAGIIGKSRPTIQRWKRLDVFRKAMEDLAEQRAAAIARAVETHTTREGDDFLSAIQEFQRSQVEIHKLQVAFGIEVLARAKRIFGEMPDEKLSATARELMSVIAGGQNLISEGGDSWAAAIGVDECVKRMSAQKEEDQNDSDFSSMSEQELRAIAYSDGEPT